MLTVINTPQAPEDYSYHVDVPCGGHITLNTDGTASVPRRQLPKEPGHKNYV